MIRAAYACLLQRQLARDACTVFHVPNGERHSSNSNLFVRNLHDRSKNQLLKRVQLGHSQLRASVACIGTMVSIRSRPHCDVRRIARTALLKPSVLCTDIYGPHGALAKADRSCKRSRCCMPGPWQDRPDRSKAYLTHITVVDTTVYDPCITFVS